MSMKAGIFYRMSDYPNRPRISIHATSPINVQDLRAFLMMLQNKHYAGKQPSFSISSVSPDTGEVTTIMEIDSETAVEDVDLSAVRNMSGADL